MSNRPQDLKSDHISVCICTFHRPELLARALSGVTSQSTKAEISYEVVVVDNDCHRSAEETVRRFQPGNAAKIIYDCEPVQNIALTRNRAILNATGNFIAFIDDDETPAEDWLYSMYQCIKDYNADAALGPVLPEFPKGAPEWLKKSGLCDRPRNATGLPITERDLRTGNILFQRYIFEKGDLWFNPSRGLTGGEDGEFISKQLRKGRRFVWCDEAPVFEIVPEERWPALFYLKKNYRIGTLYGEKLRRAGSIIPIMQSVILFSGYTLLLPLSFIGGQHIWMKLLTKLSYNTGRLLGFLGISFLRRRE